MNGPPPKKPFTDPTLVVYGDIQSVTLSIGGTGALDTGAMMGMSKTR